MLKSFYKYIVKELLLGYLKNNNISKGSRYYIVVEDKNHRENLMEAIKEYGEPITLSGIYQGNSSLIKEEEYNTYVLNPGDNALKMIIGYDVTSKEDYLTTIRNSVGVVGNKYENYGVLYILSDSILSSIITACQDLQGEGCPLNAKYIIENIRNKAENEITRNFECIYLYNHLDKISEYISDGTCSLFDFEHALNVLGDKKLLGHYNDLEFFNDKSIYDSTFKPTDEEMNQRVEKNHLLYRKIHDIMNEDEKEDRLSLLVKFLDEQLSKKINKHAESEEWKQIDLQEILDSIQRKNITANLALENIFLEKESLMTSLVKSAPKGTKKRSTTSVIICDQSDSEYQNIVIRFNKEISSEQKKEVNTKDFQINGCDVKYKIKEDLIKSSIGISDNHHDFYIMKLHCPQNFFKNIDNNFSLNKKGDITIIAPDDDRETLILGDGEEKINLPIDNNIEWKDNYKLELPLIAENEDIDKITFTISFGTKKVKFILKLYTAKSIPPIGPEFPQDKILHPINDFEKITDGETERSTFGYWRPYLEWEQAFINNNSTFIRFEHNELTNIEEPVFEQLYLSENIKQPLLKIYDYYRNNDTIPSLCPLNDELRNLYRVYWHAVKKEIEKITPNRGLEKQEYNITKLGVVSYMGKIYFSPFHPIMVAYVLEYDNKFDNKEESSFAKKLLSPFYLIPYLYYDSKPMRPYTDSLMSKIKYWLCYEDVNSKPQERTNDITTKMVESKMEAFIEHFKYLFPDKDCPIIISTIGIIDDTNVIKGIIQFIKKQCNEGVQKIEIHEYVDNILEETFFEKLNRLDSIAAITNELQKINLKIESKGEYTGQEIIHQLFTRISFYKHKLSEEIGVRYSHIAFYQMDTGNSFSRPITDELRTEMSMNGLISIPSTVKKDDTYVIGFGTKGLSEKPGYIYPMAIDLNNLYANEENEGSSAYNNRTCVAKRYKFSKDTLLNSIYENTNWVTFINPEVDIDFFYKQNLYIVHYTDQYTINAKYDSITVTKHVKQYENMLRKSYEKYCLSEEKFKHFNITMMNYFNCLNGSWMLNIVNKTEKQIREKMSIVAASIAMLRFMNRNENIIWIPISLEEILRVTGSIGLPQDYIFTKKALGAKGAMSDDLLMMGLDSTDHNNLKLYFYPVEVKVSTTNSMSSKANIQVSNTYLQFKEHILGNSNFTKHIYRTFFASQYLTNAEKLNANSLLTTNEYEEIEKCRFSLLNLKYTVEERLPIKEMGCAAVISFFSQTSHSLNTSVINGVPICDIHLSEKECFQSVAEPDNNNLNFLHNDTIHVEDNSEDTEVNENEREKEVLNRNAISISTIDEDAEENTKDEENNTDIQDEDKSAVKEQREPNIESEITKSQSIKIVVGHTPINKRKIVFEPNNTRMVSHPNMGIIGTMGTGKTQFARSLIAQFSKESQHNVGGKPIGILVFDYKGDYKDKEFLDAVSGESYKFNFPFNPLKLVVNDEVDGINLPAITADRISDSFAKAYGLGLKQQNNIKQVIIETYEDAGITREPRTWENTVPTIEDVINKYFEKYDANDKAYALFDKLRDYTIFTPDNSYCVSLFEWLNKVRVIDLTLYPDDTKKVIVSLILDLFYAEMRQLGGSKQENGLRELRAMIMVDEAHQFMKKDFNSFRSIISEGRMFGVGMILSTQNICDFKTQKEDYSQFILSWIIHHVNSISKSEIASIFGASDNNSDLYMDFINKAKLFESICKIGQEVESVRDLPFFELIKQDKRFVKEG